MNKREIKKYLFPTLRIKHIKHKYFKQLKKLIGVENFLGYKDASDDDRVDIQEKYAIQIEEYIRSRKKNRTFIRAYNSIYLNEIAEVLLHSIVIDELFDKINSLDDIYYDKNNVLYFDNEYPRLFMDKGNIIDYCELEAKITTHIKLYFLRAQMEGRVNQNQESRKLFEELRKDIMATSREELEKLAIFELRRQARLVGVERPLSKNREQLINEIISIVNGKTI